MPDAIPVVFYRVSSYDYHFIIKVLANQFQAEFECCRESKKMYEKIFILIRKEITKIDKEGNESVTFISNKIKVIDNAKFMPRSLSNLVNNLAVGIHKIKCKGCDCFLENESVQDNLIKYKCLSCNTGYSNKPDEELRNKFKNIIKLSNNDVNKVTLLLRIGVYWEKFNEITLLEKEDFYINLNMERNYRCRLYACKKCF